ncbi:MAG: hypothetical protein SH868_02320 [Bythopirellula sp.]|nr:hypothetical protein [Bythopirellula sp.]
MSTGYIELNQSQESHARFERTYRATSRVRMLSRTHGQEKPLTPVIYGYCPANAANPGESPVFYISQLYSVPRSDLAILVPFTVVTEHLADDNYVASIQSARVYASADTYTEVIENLRNTLCHLYWRLTTIKNENLGDKAKEQKAVLNRHIARIPNAASF